MEIAIRENERVDDLQRNGYRIIQNTKKFCFGMDAVLLSGFVWEGESTFASKKRKAVDLGTGTGIIPLLLHGRMMQSFRNRQHRAALTPEKSSDRPGRPVSDREGMLHIIGIEIQPEMADMAQRSVQLNGLSDDIRIICADLKDAAQLLGKASCDVVTSNPPYMKCGGGLKNPDDSKAISRHEVACTFEDVAREASALLIDGGRFYLVHRPERLTELICTLCSYKLEPKRIRMVHSFADSEATMVLIESRKGSGQFLKVEKPLVIYKEKGVYCDEIYDIYGY